MIQLPQRFFCGQLSRHVSKLGVHRGQHQRAVSEPSTVTSRPPVPPGQGKEYKEIQIPVPWGHVSGKWWGRTDVQPVVMLHGWQDNAGSFDNLVPLLHNESLFAFDMVGHGKSSHYPLGQSYSYMDAVVNLRGVIRHFGWEKVSLIGHSFGSVVGFSYAASFPDLIDKFVNLDDIGGWIILSLPPAAEETRQVIDANLSFEKKLKDFKSRRLYSYDEIVDRYSKGSNGSLDREAAKVILRRGLVKSPDNERVTFSFSRDSRCKIFSLVGMSEEYIYALSSQITYKVLHIKAAKSFTSTPSALKVFEKSRDIVEKIAQTYEFHVVDGTHHVHLNNPELVAPIINKFFETKEHEKVY